MMNTLKSILFLILTGFTLFSSATIVTSNGTGGGSWDDPNSWSPIGVPGCVDTISVLAGDIIDIDTQQDYEACPPMVVLVYGTIHFPDNGPKFRLPCDSRIDGFAGGSITAPGTDNSNKIFICGDVVWESIEDDLSGPFSLFLAVLPVKLIDFEAKVDNTAVNLYWSTATELNNDYFTIERSLNGLTFDEIGRVSGSGNSNVVNNYEFTDDSPIEGTYYYRLKQTDYNGEFEYVKLITINYLKEEDGTCVLNVYPNPCTGNCTINLENCPLAENEVNVQLYDALGNRIINKISPKSQTNDISFHLNENNNLAPGVYIVSSQSKSKKQSQKVIIK